MIFDMTKRKGGGGTINYADYATGIRFGANIPSSVVDISLPEATTAASMFYHDRASSPYTQVTVTFGKKITSLSGFCECYQQNVRGLTSITINGDFSKCTTYSLMTKNNADLQGIYGSPLDFSSVTNENFSKWAGTIPALTYVRYAPNTLNVNHNIAGAPALDADSLVSIANGLKAIAKTLTLHATPKSLLSTIMGIVSNNGTYDVFTADTSGTTSLLSFITTTKGWTVA